MVKHKKNKQYKCFIVIRCSKNIDMQMITKILFVYVIKSFIASYKVLINNIRYKF